MRVVGREAGLLSYLHFAMFAVTATTMPSLHPLLQVLGRGEAPNRGCRPGVWIWMREDRSLSFTRCFSVLNWLYLVDVK